MKSGFLQKGINNNNQMSERLLAKRFKLKTHRTSFVKSKKKKLRPFPSSPQPPCQSEAKAPFIWRKVVPGKRVTLLAESTLLSVYMRNKLTPLPEPRANFSPYKHFASPSRVNSVKERRSEHVLCCYWKVSSWLGQRGQLFSHINAR